MADEQKRRVPRHAFNGRLVYDGVIFVLVLLIGVGFWYVAFRL